MVGEYGPKDQLTISQKIEHQWISINPINAFSLDPVERKKTHNRKTKLTFVRNVPEKQTV